MRVCSLAALMTCDSVAPDHGDANDCADVTDFPTTRWLWTSNSDGDDQGAYQRIRKYAHAGNSGIQNEIDVVTDSINETYEYFCCTMGPAKGSP